MTVYLRCEKGFYLVQEYHSGDWICIEKPTNEELASLEQNYKIPNSFLIDTKDLDERPRMESENGWTLIIFRIPIKKEMQANHFGTIPLCILFSKQHFITICNEETEMFSDFLEFSRRKSLSKISQMELVLRLIMSSSVWFMNYTKLINNEVIESEQKLERSIRNEDLLSLMKLDKSMVYFESSLKGNEILLEKIESMIFSAEQNQNLYADVRTELHQAREMVSIYHETLDSTMDAFASIISNNVNTIMKRMTSISLILMLPTVIASFYGMNVINYIEQTTWGFVFIIVLSVMLSTVAFFWLKRNKWF